MSIDVEMLYRRYGPLVHRRCLGLLGEGAAAGAALEETFVRLLRYQARLSRRGLASLLYRMATNVCLHALRAGAPVADADGALARIARAPEVELSAAGRLLRLVDREQESPHAMAVLHLVDGMSISAIADETGLAPAAVASRLRALGPHVAELAHIDPDASDPAAAPAPLDLERHLLGELPAERADALDRLLATDPALAARVAGLRQQGEALFAERPPPEMATLIETRAGVGPTARTAGSWMVWAAPVVVAGLAMVASYPPRPPQDPEASGAVASAPALEAAAPTPAAPTEPELTLHVGADADAPQIEDGATLEPGAVVQLRYTAAGQAHGVVVSIDEAATARLHWPPSPGGTTALDAGPGRPAGAALDLGPGPGFARFYFVTSAVPLDAAVVLAAAQELADNGLAKTALALPLQQQVQQDTALLRRPAAP